MLRIIDENYELLNTAQGAAVVPRAGARIVRPLRRGWPSLSSELAAAYYDRYGSTCAASARTEALAVLDGQAQVLPRTEIFTRVGRCQDGIAVDLGHPDSEQTVVISPGSWRLVERSPVLFTRSRLTLPMPTPQRGGSLDELRGLLNVTDEQWDVLVAWLAAALIPDIARPVLLLRGEKGTAKTTALWMLVMLVDPCEPATRKPPRDAEGWVTAAAGSQVVAIDNVSYIPDWWSDALCRAVTGDGDVRRKLYADADLVTFAFRRTIAMSAIALPTLRDDLADRLLPLQLVPIGTPTVAGSRPRREETEVRAQAQQVMPHALGGLCDLVAAVLAVRSKVKVQDPPRMADFARVVAAVDEVRGTKALATYRRTCEGLASEVIEADEVIAAIVDFLTGETLDDVLRPPRPFGWGPSLPDTTGSWTGTIAELYDRILPYRPSPTWPKTARALTSRIERGTPALRAAGFTWTRPDERTAKGRPITFAPIEKQ